ncbi:hypothetical protein BBM55_15880 [Vibrio parahaemolyticus]|nr:hypothetical protein BBM55_15880 [Vibrio parahaemolyticus]
MRWRKQIITKHLRGILNAWQFQFKSALVLNVAKFRFGWSRCSPLNAALAAKTGNNETYHFQDK